MAEKSREERGGQKQSNRRLRLMRGDGEVTYNRILEAAGELFANYGFADTSNKMIAAQASVDMASINYHFGSRDKLYEAVLRESHRRLISVDRLQFLNSSTLCAHEKLRLLIQEFVGGISAQQGWSVKVLSRAFLAQSSHFNFLLSSELPLKIPFILAILSEITGIEEKDPALLRCLVSVMAPCAILLAFGANAPPPYNALYLMPPDVLAQHFYLFALGGLEALKKNNQ